MATISIGSTLSGASTNAGAAGAKGFGSVMAGQADSAAQDEADTRVAAKSDEQDQEAKDRQDAKDRARAVAEDPAALIALANSVAAITRADAATAKAATDKAAATASVAAGAPAATAATPAQPADAAADNPADAAALSAALPGAAQATAAKAAKTTPKTAIGDTNLSTADILAARSAKVAPVDTAQGDGQDAADSGAGNGGGTATPDPLLAAATTLAPASTLAADALSPTGGAVLATGAADRQLDLAKGDAWLDGLARDIASTADSNGKLSFQLSPPALGALQVQLTRGDDGTSVKMTTATVDAQTILADAKPRLIEAAHAHGVKISDATIDLGGAGTATSDQQRDFSQNGGSASGQSNAASANAGGDAHRQAQSQAQSEPDLYPIARRQSAIAGAATASARRDLDAGYA